MIMADREVMMFGEECIPGWSEESQSLYEEFEDSGNPETADHLLRSLDASRMDKWTSAVERMNFARSSRKALGLLRKLGGCNRNVVGNASINPNQIANRIVDISRAPSDENHTRDVKQSLRDLERSTSSSSEFSHDFSAEELEQGLKDTKVEKAAGFDGIYPEFLEEQQQLSGFSDSDYASDEDTRKSTTGYIFNLCNGAITWSSKRQHAVTLSTTEAEYIAACQATKEAIWIRRLMNDIGESVSMAIPLNIDNQSAIKLIHNPEFHNRTKHVDIQFHFVREKFQDGEIEPVYVSTKLQEADPLTKALPRTSFLDLRNLIVMKKKNEINVK
ncbi:hypothetical protein JTB14_014719 [Gonioctena quinquepunctata]|nr:hypothetical protein JTB14_014719 [Gonioctena quinquepunctata]